MLKQPAVAMSLLMLASAAAQASDCLDQPTQTGMDICAGRAFKKADAEMNARYRKIVACLKDEAAPLVEAQRDWLAFRDAECKFQGTANEGGSMQRTVLAECAASVTTQRSKELDYYLTCQEGDFSCPTWGCGFGKAETPGK